MITMITETSIPKLFNLNWLFSGVTKFLSVLQAPQTLPFFLVSDGHRKKEILRDWFIKA